MNPDPSCPLCAGLGRFCPCVTDGPQRVCSTCGKPHHTLLLADWDTGGDEWRECPTCLVRSRAAVALLAKMMARAIVMGPVGERRAVA